MAERRMFTRKITDDDNFMALSASAQALYLHLSMSADDDGFCNQVSISMFKAHASVQDLQALLEKRYLYQFDNGVIVIKHWRMANALRKDRYTPTNFQEELSKLQLKSNGAYTMISEDKQLQTTTDGNWLPDGCQVVAERLPQDSIGKDSIDKVSIYNPPISPLKGEEDTSKRERFTPPTIEEVAEYCRSRDNGIDAEEFWHFYNSKGWMVGRGKMKNWKSAVVTWEKSAKQRAKKSNDIDWDNI